MFVVPLAKMLLVGLKLGKDQVQAAGTSPDFPVACVLIMAPVLPSVREFVCILKVFIRADVGP